MGGRAGLPPLHTPLPARMRISCRVRASLNYLLIFCYSYFLSFFVKLNEFYYIYSCTTIITTQLFNISTPDPPHRPSLPWQPVAFGHRKFFEVCESISVLQRSSLCLRLVFLKKKEVKTGKPQPEGCH